MYCMSTVPLDTLRPMHRGIVRVIDPASTAVRLAACVQIAQQFFQQQSQQQ
jgi:hypothetical protein